MRVCEFECVCVIVSLLVLKKKYKQEAHGPHRSPEQEWLTTLTKNTLND